VAIDLEKFSPQHASRAFRKSVGIGPNDVVILFVGRLVYEKRPDIFANVIRRLNEEGLDFKALVIGAGKYEDEMRKLPKTICTGYVAFDRLPIAYASCDIFLFPSSLETFGNVTLEAAASGLPLVVESGCSGHLVVDGVTGYACQAGDEEAFYKATRSLLVDNESRKKFSVRSREHSKNFEKRAVVQKMLSYYEQVTEDFYDKYKGKHYLRDKAFQNETSFRAGPMVQPMGLRFFCGAVLFFGAIPYHLSDLWCFLKKVLGLKWSKAIDDSMSNKEDASASAAPKEAIAWVVFLIEVILAISLFFIRIQAHIEYEFRVLFSGRP